MTVGASPFQQAIEAVWKPLAFAARDDFQRLERVRDLESTVAAAAARALELAIPRDAKQVLGRIAEQWLARALARSEDLSHFVTSPWSLFFLVLAAFSVFFPKYQDDRGKKFWTLLYPAIFMISLSVPAFMMGGAVRIGLGILLIAMGVRSLVKHHRKGWKVDPAASGAPQLREG